MYVYKQAYIHIISLSLYMYIYIYMYMYDTLLQLVLPLLPSLLGHRPRPRHRPGGHASARGRIIYYTILYYTIL